MKLTQNEIEAELSDIVPRGVRKQIAAETGIYESVMYAYYNADDERKSPAFCLLLIQAALDEIDAGVGDAHWAAINRLRALSRPAVVERLCVKSELSESFREDADLAAAHVQELSLYDQLRECDESLNQKRRVRAAILEAIHLEKESFNGGKTRINGTNGNRRTNGILPPEVVERAREKRSRR